jgi:hypothetical protein
MRLYCGTINCLIEEAFPLNSADHQSYRLTGHVMYHVMYYSTLFDTHIRLIFSRQYHINCLSTQKQLQFIYAIFSRLYLINSHIFVYSTLHLAGYFLIRGFNEESISPFKEARIPLLMLFCHFICCFCILTLYWHKHLGIYSLSLLCCKIETRTQFLCYQFLGDPAPKLENGIGNSKENLLGWFSRSHEVIAGMWRTTGYTLCTPCSSLPFLVIEFMHVSIIVQLTLYIYIL